LKGPGCNNGIRNRNLKEQLCLRSKEKLQDALGKSIGLETVKSTFRPLSRIRKMTINILWRSRPPPKRKKRLPTVVMPEIFLPH
jgi:hypothetical protein